jgi:hypothetical protein
LARGNGLLRTVALTGQPAPDTTDNFMYLDTGSAVINEAGQVAYRADFKDPVADRGVFSEGSGHLALVVRNGMHAPGLPDGTNFTFDLEPNLNNAGHTAVLAQLPHLLTGLWSDASGTLELLAAAGQRAPETPEGVRYISGFSLFAFNDSGKFAFHALLQGPGVSGNNNRGIWSGVPGNLNLLARSGSQAPGTPTGVNFDNLFIDVALNDRGHTAFRGVLSGPGVRGTNRYGIWSDRTGNMELVVRSGSQAPGFTSGVNLTTLGFGDFNALDQFAFVASLAGPGVDSANDDAIWVEDAGSFRLVAREGSQAPGLTNGVVFSSLRPPLLNNVGKAAFTAALAGNGEDLNNLSLWREASTGLEIVARLGSQAPGAPTGVILSQFASLAFNSAGQIAFQGYLSGAGSVYDSGLWATDRTGGLTLIARSGDPLEVAPSDIRVVQRLSFVGGNGDGNGTPSGLNANGQIAFSATFTDGTSGVFVSNLVAVPEPAGMGLVLVGGAWLLKQRRKAR